MSRDDYISDERVVKLAAEAVRLELEKKKALDIPIVIFDSKTQKIYKEYSNGHREEIADRLREGRYSERFAEKA